MMAVVVPLTLIIALVTGVLSIVVAIIFSILVFREDPGNEDMIKISKYIEDGAKKFLWVQYRILSIFVLVLFVVILLFLRISYSIVALSLESIEFFLKEIIIELGDLIYVFTQLDCTELSSL